MLSTRQLPSRQLLLWRTRPPWLRRTRRLRTHILRPRRLRTKLPRTNPRLSLPWVLRARRRPTEDLRSKLLRTKALTPRTMTLRTEPLRTRLMWTRLRTKKASLHRHPPTLSLNTLHTISRTPHTRGPGSVPPHSLHLVEQVSYGGLGGAEGGRGASAGEVTGVQVCVCVRVCVRESRVGSSGLWFQV